MNDFLNNTVGSELFFVYGLIALVVILIIVIILIDKKESRKKPQNLFDTLNMKIIANLDDVNNKTIEPEIIEINQKSEETNFNDLKPISEVNIVESSEIEDLETISTTDEDIYVESDLEKTQAQIRVEEITNALKNAQIEEQIQEDKYAKFEEEQEKNAIISYNELKESFDKLYSENEKIQYLEDDEIPINIEELYKIQNVEKESEKVQLEDFSSLKDTTVNIPVQSTFKSSPYISPVYGIQEPKVEIKHSTDNEIENANQFLQSLKELKNNLD